MHLKDYTIAADLYKEVTKSKSFTNLPERNKEKWELYKAYLQLLALNFKINDFGNLQTEEKIESLSDTLKVYKKDKQGLFIPLFIALILYFYFKKETDGLYFLSKQIDNYYYRHLDDKITPRTKQFISLIKELIKFDFERKKSLELLSLNEKDFKETALTSMHNFEGVEIIPYEHLFKMMQEFLKKDIHKTL